jgi:hypothetical protein
MICVGFSSSRAAQAPPPSMAWMPRKPARARWPRGMRMAAAGARRRGSRRELESCGPPIDTVKVSRRHSPRTQCPQPRSVRQRTDMPVGACEKGTAAPSVRAKWLRDALGGSAFRGGELSCPRASSEATARRRSRSSQRSRPFRPHPFGADRSRPPLTCPAERLERATRGAQPGPPACPIRLRLSGPCERIVRGMGASERSALEEAGMMRTGV